MHGFISTVFYDFQQSIPFAVIGLAVGIALLVILKRKYSRDGKHFPKGQAVAVLLLLCYLGGLVGITFLDRTDGIQLGIQLYPFLAFREAWNTFTLRTWLNPLLNIAMFLPFGVLLPLAIKPIRHWYWILVAGAGTSLVIEAFQYIFSLGQADVDDLFCNVLGTMLGYYLCMLFVSLAEKQWKIAGGYIALPVLFAVILAGAFLIYYFQPYGNLADAPIYAANTKKTEWIPECSLTDDPISPGVYWTEPFTTEGSDAFAVEFVERQGAEIRFGTPDVIYYDSSAFYSDHSTYALWVNYNDRSYEYTDYRVDAELRYSNKGGTISEDGLRTELEKLGIEIPDAAEFITVDEEKGEYAFRADCVIENAVLTDGKITCRVTENGLLCNVENTLSVSTLYENVTVISPQEAYELLCAGRFSWRDVLTFNYQPPQQVRVIDCRLEYIADSKGFRQPVYAFTLSDENDSELRGGDSWTTFVPALAGS